MAKLMSSKNLSGLEKNLLMLRRNLRRNLNRSLRRNLLRKL